MFVRSTKWSVKSIILVSLIGVIIGVIFAYGFGNLYSLIQALMLPTGLAPVIETSFTGLWLIAAPLAMYFVPTPGSGLIGELLASIIEMALGGQWGISTILKGLIQGATNEIGFFPKKERYQKFSWGSTLIGSFFGGLGCFLVGYILGWYKYALKVKLAMLIVNQISAVLFDGVLAKLITDLFEKTLRPKLK